MKLNALWAVILAAPVASLPSRRDTNAWIAPSATDRRSPCPLVNSLANHGFLPRDGLNISMDILKVALRSSVNLAEGATELVGGKALEASTTGNPNTFHLDDLNTHGVIEHDASLSRADTFFGDNHSFNSTIWAQTSATFTDKTISLRTAAKARIARVAAAKAANPKFSMSLGDHTASMIETALYFSLLSNGTSSAVTDWVRILFEEERLPIEEGWKKPSGEISVLSVLALVAQLTIAGI